MPRNWFTTLIAVPVIVGCWLAASGQAQAQGLDANRFYHYPFYYFPHNYWPGQSAAWPEAPGSFARASWR